jgi:hypothetical protein
MIEWETHYFIEALEKKQQRTYANMNTGMITHKRG